MMKTHSMALAPTARTDRPVGSSGIDKADRQTVRQTKRTDLRTYRYTHPRRKKKETEKEDEEEEKKPLMRTEGKRK